MVFPGCQETIVGEHTAPIRVTLRACRAHYSPIMVVRASCKINILKTHNKIYGEHENIEIIENIEIHRHFLGVDIERKMPLPVRRRYSSFNQFENFIIHINKFEHFIAHLKQI